MIVELNKYYGTMKSRDEGGLINRGDWFKAEDDDEIIMIYLGDDLVLYINENDISMENIEDMESNNNSILEVQDIVDRYPLDFIQPMLGNLVDEGLMYP